ncbi:MAG TPA: sulfotransferase [Candidatus Acidoferrum sp.]|nr:sulfotransferase [Candidatus Acidoferrum sp.]
MAAKPEISLRKKAPVFVLGCGRSGTTLLYHMLLSSGNFAVYRTESNVINLLEPRFGDLSAAVNKRRLLDAWYKTRLYTLSELEKGPLEERVMAECKNGGDFLRIIMEQMAGKQGVERWADTTPEHLLHLHRIKETIPNALIIHIIRDGRDVALSTDKQGYIRRLRWDKTPSVMVAGVYWEWMVNKGRRDGRDLGSDYTEVRFEDLVAQPQQTLAKLGSFIDHDLDYDRIQKVGIGSVSAPNTSFQEGSSELFHPAGRWKHNYTPESLAAFEGLVGGTLEELGYELGTKDRSLLDRANLKRMRLAYRTYFDSKLYLKAKTPLGKLLVTRDMSWI